MESLFAPCSDFLGVSRAPKYKETKYFYKAFFIFIQILINQSRSEIKFFDLENSFPIKQ